MAAVTQEREERKKSSLDRKKLQSIRVVAIKKVSSVAVTQDNNKRLRNI